MRASGTSDAHDAIQAVIDTLCEELFGAADDREQIVLRYSLLRSAECSASVALRTALDEWSNRRVNEERRMGIWSGYRRGPHWERVTTICRVLADDRCEYGACSTRAWLQGHHHHYESVGWESLYAVSMLCADCHRRLSHGGSYIEDALLRVREAEWNERDVVLRALGEDTPPDGMTVAVPPDLVE